MDKLQAFIDTYNVDAELYETAGEVKTVEQSAALGVQPEQIIKSLLFVGEKPVLVLVRGDCRADEAKLEKLFPGIHFANANEVRKITGYGPGEVPPLMEGDFIRIMDRKVAAGNAYEGGGGKPRRHIRITVAELQRVQQWTVEDIT